MPQTTVPTTAVPKTRSTTGRRRSANVLVDNAFFIFGGAAAVWLAWIALTESFAWGWFLVLFFVLFWLLLAYLVLPRLHRILTTIYVPDYFIGRARTSDGLLGDPINLAVLGSEAKLDEAMTRAGWTRADEVTLASSWRIVASTLLRRSYDEAPVSPLFLFGHQQDIAYQQEVKGNPAKRHHVRFWRCPDGWLLPGGHRADWMAAGTFDRAVGFSLFTLQVTHKIDANTDIERDHIVSSLTGADIGVGVDVIRDFSSGYHSRNGGGDSIETDGDLPVLDVRPVAVDETSVAVADHADNRRAALAERRPVPTVLGFLLMLLRVVAGGIFILLTVLEWRTFVQSVVIDPTTGSIDPTSLQVAEVVLAAVMVIMGIGLFVYLALAVFVYLGHNWARIAAMAFSAFLVVAAAINYFEGHGYVPLRNNLLGLPLDILVVLALSSQRSRLWARRVRPRPGDAGAATENAAADETTTR
ncbi:LssY C-terminal domain-containing protein [Leifsonia poae]|uniref:LssY C-terminal domain-containing protein n=1 Tax=Leifsonia poae TaxID=110933 RepID=UPI001CBA7A48|nr:LssY C-terminal domain-containing protein [Leifsonia poae]